MAWTKENVETMTKLWAEGLSASAIADRIGGMSRNAVIGKVHRMGLATRSITRTYRKAIPKRLPRATAKQFQARDFEGKMLKGLTVPLLKGEPLPPEPVRPAKLTSFADLEPNMCRFVFGDPKTKDSGFCGCNAVPGLPYCEGHHKFCNTGAPQPRSRVRTYVPHKSNGYRILANSVRGFE
jgi:GcrA cell cycle regulator